MKLSKLIAINELAAAGFAAHADSTINSYKTLTSERTPTLKIEEDVGEITIHILLSYPEL